MKRYLNIINGLIVVTIFSIVIGITSCTKLKDKSYNEILTDNFNPTEEDIGAMLASGYTSWRKILLFWNGYWRVQENCADEIITPARPNGWVDGGVFRRMHRHTWAVDDDITFQTWARTYSGIADCNRLIYSIQSGTLSIVEDKKVATLAELKVLRASYYYLLCDMYGNVPIDTIFNVPAGYIPPQNTRTEVYNFIVNEITTSIPYLSPDRGGLYYNRFNQWSARTLLAKVYLNAEVYTGTAHWTDCLAQCNEIITNSGYILEPVQKNVFKTENQGSNEIIFGIAIDDKYTQDWNSFDIHMQTLQPANQATYNLTSGPWGGMCAIPQFIDTFDPADKRLTDNYIRGQQYSSSGAPLNCTMGGLAGQPLAYINEVLPIDQTCEEIHGYRFCKFEIGFGSSNILNNDYPLLRYTDVLMMKAECLLRTGDANGAAAIVTQVRGRAFTDPAKAVVTGAQLQGGSGYAYGLRDAGGLGTTNEGGADITYGRFLDELGWEFNQEGRRRQDMIRFGAFSSKSYLGYQGSTSKAYTSLYPIPLSALQTNGNLKQNAGYQ